MTARRIIRRMGGTGSVARLCGVANSTVTAWKKTNRIPDHRLTFLREAYEEMGLGDTRDWD